MGYFIQIYEYWMEFYQEENDQWNSNKNME